MRLIELNPDWINASDEHTYEVVDTLAEAQGLWFLCPVCFARNGGVVGTHHILCWFNDRAVPPGRSPGPGRWTPTGTDFKDVTLSPSVELPGSLCHAHFNIVSGQIVI